MSEQCTRPAYECAHARSQADQWAYVQTQLAPLCPCDSNPSTSDGPQQECPIHGDGASFVGYVQALERAAIDAYGDKALRIIWAEVSS
jgi:hypothetical protein